MCCTPSRRNASRRSSPGAHGFRQHQMIAMTSIRQLLPGLALVLLAGSSSLAQVPSLPGGATTLSESHGAWTVACAIRQQQDETGVRVCALSQQQFAQQTRQRALAIELRPEGGGARGTLILPFGLALAEGVIYRVDDGQISAPQHFRTCLPGGCLIDIDFDAHTIAGLEAGNTLNVIATADGGQALTFTISLAGFSSGFDRVVELLQA